MGTMTDFLNFQDLFKEMDLPVPLSPVPLTPVSSPRPMSPLAESVTKFLSFEKSVAESFELSFAESVAKSYDPCSTLGHFFKTWALRGQTHGHFSHSTGNGSSTT
ncbi:hypothetical protein NPIL_123271 [Nephila pilipes]|uniref:Uncharacterized protein n=1 Tax=Nephila pilipes TaxID=299642 RepID=A0A8X6I5R8_NEPPI|nr:hypothetical protein NPIL_123271 [Nephila pilipes]